MSADDDGMMDTRSADAANRKLSSSGLLHLTAKIAAEIYVGRAGEPVGPRNAQRTYEIHDAVNEAAALLTVALTPSLAAESYRIAAATYGVPSLLDAVAASETVG